MDIHVFWEGPWSLNDLEKLKNDEKDYGVYQIYGCHPLYGHSVLLYIGKAIDQTFGQRISQENWQNTEDGENIEIYIGRLASQKQLTCDEWDAKIDQAEKLLIFAHAPAYNTQNTRSLPEPNVMNNRIFNWNCQRDLFPEVSGNRYTSRFDHILEEHIITTKRIKS
ncbi:MAG: hypothetical protein QME27_05580 [Syntrophaceae bacterium]|nr:hypothetical protein [Syntrophaceae bacterium]